MSAINGTNVLLYYNGTAIAMQKGLTLGLDVDLADATNKGSGGWAEHFSGMRNAKIDFNSLFSTGLMTDETPILGAKDLMDYIINRSSLLVSILGGPFPIIGKVDMSSLSFEAPLEGAMTLSGSLKVNGRLYILSSAYVLADAAENLITDPDGGGAEDYTTLTVVDLAITSAITASTGYCRSNTISVVSGNKYKLIFFLTHTSGQYPSVAIYDNTSADISNVVTLVAGLNFVELTATLTDPTASLKFRNTGAANWNTSPIYLFG